MAPTMYYSGLTLDRASAAVQLSSSPTSRPWSNRPHWRWPMLMR